MQGKGAIKKTLHNTNKRGTKLDHNMLMNLVQAVWVSFIKKHFSLCESKQQRKDVVEYISTPTAFGPGTDLEINKEEAL